LRAYLLGELGDVEAVGDNNEVFGFGLQSRVSRTQFLQDYKLEELLGDDGGVDNITDSNGDDLVSLFKQVSSLIDS
jgi:hypothetical protein